MSIKKIVPIVSDDPKVSRAVSIVGGMADSETNAVIFRDSPEVWFQFYLGLYLEKPTFVLIKKVDLTDDIDRQLTYLNVKKVIVEEFNDKALRNFTEMLAKWIKK